MSPCIFAGAANSILIWPTDVTAPGMKGLQQTTDFRESPEAGKLSLGIIQSFLNSPRNGQFEWKLATSRIPSTFSFFPFGIFVFVQGASRSLERWTYPKAKHQSILTPHCLWEIRSCPKDRLSTQVCIQVFSTSWVVPVLFTILSSLPRAATLYDGHRITTLSIVPPLKGPKGQVSTARRTMLRRSRKVPQMNGNYFRHCYFLHHTTTLRCSP